MKLWGEVKLRWETGSRRPVLQKSRSYCRSWVIQLRSCWAYLGFPGKGGHRLQASSSTGRCPGTSPAAPAPHPVPAASGSRQDTPEPARVPAAGPRHPFASLGSRSVYLSPGNAWQPSPRVGRSHPGHRGPTAPPSCPGLTQHRPPRPKHRRPQCGPRGSVTLFPTRRPGGRQTPGVRGL